MKIIVRNKVTKSNILCEVGCEVKYGDEDCKGDCSHCSHDCSSYCPQD